jgi:undecaprenyl-diphosphatase
MTIFESIILGIVQGITEFLPISSTGHLWVVEHFVFDINPSIALGVAFHFATLLSIIVVFWKKILSLFINLFDYKNYKKNTECSFAWKLILATAITGIFGIIGKKYIDDIVTMKIISITLIVTGVFILLSEYLPKYIQSGEKYKKMKEFTWVLAILLGFVQAIAIIPGISRSGSTIVFLLLVGIAKRKSLEISFLLSIPTILASFIFLIPNLHVEINSGNINMLALMVGGLVASITAYVTIKFMMKYIEKVWPWFAVWCFIVSFFLFLS